MLEYVWSEVYVGVIIVAFVYILPHDHWMACFDSNCISYGGFSPPCFGRCLRERGLSVNFSRKYARNRCTSFSFDFYPESLRERLFHADFGLNDSFLVSLSIDDCINSFPSSSGESRPMNIYNFSLSIFNDELSLLVLTRINNYSSIVSWVYRAIMWMPDLPTDVKNCFGFSKDSPESPVMDKSRVKDNSCYVTRVEFTSIRMDSLFRDVMPNEAKTWLIWDGNISKEACIFIAWIHN